MKKFITPTYAFSPGLSGVGFINLSGINGFDVKNLVSIINQTKGVVIYATGSQSLKYTNVVGTTVTLFADTSSMSSGDTLQVIYEDNSALEVVSDVVTVEGATASGNTLNEVSEDFSASLDTDIWDVSYLNQGSTFYAIGGEALGSSYLKISMCPYTINSEFLLTSKQTFSLSLALKYSYSASKRMFGNQLEVGIASVDSNDDIEYIVQKPDVAIPASITVSTGEAFVVFAANHSFVTGDRIIMHGNSDSRLNCMPTYVRVVSETAIAFDTTIPAGTYSADGFIRFVDSLSNVDSGANTFIGDNVNVTSLEMSSRNKGKSARRNNTFAYTSIATVGASPNFSDNFTPANEFIVKLTNDNLVYVSKEFEALSSNPATTKFIQNIPSPDKRYKLFIRSKNLASMSRPVAKIVSAVKSGTTIATITTENAHGLTMGSKVAIYGIRDSTRFPNVLTPTLIDDIISPTVFTIAIGVAQTGTSAGGRVDICQNDLTVVAGSFNKAQSISRTSNILSITFLSNITGLIPGETIELYGCDATSMGLYDGPYVVGSVGLNVIKIRSIGSDFASIACGGSILKRTDFRIHQLKFSDFSKTLVNLDNVGNLDDSNAMLVKGTVQISDSATTIPVSISGDVPVTIADTVSVSDITGLTFPGLISPFTVVAGTQLVGNFFDSTSKFFRFFLDITAFSGTALGKITLQGEYKTGSYFDIYTFETISSTGTLVSPIINASAASYRFRTELQPTVTITFAPALQKFQIAKPSNVAQQVLHTANINLNTLGSVGASLFIGDCSSVMLAAVITSQTTAATLEVQFSTNGTNWFSSPGTMATIAGVVQLKKDNELWSYARVRVNAAGSAVVIREIVLRGV